MPRQVRVRRPAAARGGDGDALCRDRRGANRYRPPPRRPAMLAALMQLVDDALPGRVAPAGGERRLGGMAAVGSCSAMAGRPGLEHGCVLEEPWYGPRSERLRDEFEEGAGPLPWAIEGGGVHAHVDGRAQALCRYIAKKAGLAGMRCEEAARHLHVPAGGADGHVDGADGRDEYGFDPVFADAGGAKVLERDKERRGRIDASFRTEDQAGPPAAHGGDMP